MSAPDRRLTPDVPPDAPFRTMRLRSPVTPLRPRPAPDCGIDTEIVFGETLRIFDEIEGWAYGQAERDGYVGWLSAMRWSPCAASHAHASRRSERSSMAGPHQGPRSGGAAAGRSSAWPRWNGISRCSTAAAMSSRRILRRWASPRPTFVAVAEAYLGSRAPYLWAGARASASTARASCRPRAPRGRRPRPPRDSDMLERFFPVVLPVEPGFPDCGAATRSSGRAMSGSCRTTR